VFIDSTCKHLRLSLLKILALHLTPLIVVFNFDLVQCNRDIFPAELELHLVLFLIAEHALTIVAAQVTELGDPFEDHEYKLHVKTGSQE
jgi:hypothetical protein